MDALDRLAGLLLDSISHRNKPCGPAVHYDEHRRPTIRCKLLARPLQAGPVARHPGLGEKPAVPNEYAVAVYLSPYALASDRRKVLRFGQCNATSPRALYDGRASAEENWFERTGVADPAGKGTFIPRDGEPLADVRYVEAILVAGGGLRLFYEARLDDLTHELRTELSPPG